MRGNQRRHRPFSHGHGHRREAAHKFWQPAGEVKHYKDDWATPHSVGDANKPTPITWLVAGAEKFTPEGGAETNGLVLYSEEPLIGCDTLNGSTKTSVFQVETSDRTYAAPANSGYGDAESTRTVYANHWGASNLRAQLTPLASNSSYFKSAEQGLMATSTFSTIDAKNDNTDGSHVISSAEDVLYAPRLKSTDFSYPNNKSVTVGGADTLNFAAAHWGGTAWLRSPDSNVGGFSLLDLPGNFVNDLGVKFARHSISAAFRLNLSSVLFASAASAASSAEGGEKFSKIAADTPMTLQAMC